MNDRIDVIDALRGFAMLWMTLYHFCFDLSHFGLWSQDFYGSGVWNWQRSAIVSLFLFCAGFSQAWVHYQGQSAQRFWRRWRQVAGCALLVSLGSWLMFPQSWIYFGVLHGVALMLILVRQSLAWGAWLWLAGLLAISSRLLFEDWLLPWTPANWQAWLNAPILNWIGWISNKPITEDYVPVLPWIGVMCWGAASAHYLIRSGRVAYLQKVRSWPSLSRLGRWSLSYYMLHQPVLVAVVATLAWALG